MSRCTENGSSVEKCAPEYVPCIQDRVTNAISLKLMTCFIICRATRVKRFQMCVVSRHQLWLHLVLNNNRITIRMFCQQGNQSSDAWRTSQRWKIHTLIWSVTANMTFFSESVCCGVWATSITDPVKKHLNDVFKSRSMNTAYSGWFAF